VRRLLVRAKSNLGPDGGGFDFSVEQVALAIRPDVTGSRVSWGSALTGIARDLLAPADAVEDQDERSATKDAADWLKKLLEDSKGKMLSREVLQQAEEDGIPERTVYRARLKLGVVIKPQGFGTERRSYWTLLDGPMSAIPATSERLANMADMAGVGNHERAVADENDTEDDDDGEEF